MSGTFKPRWALLAAALALGLWAFAPIPTRAQSGTVSPGDEVDLTVQDLDGNEKSLRDLRGSVIVLNFFASW